MPSSHAIARGFFYKMCMPTFLDCVQAPSHWHSVDFVSDLHLQQDDAVWQAFVHYLQHTPADAIFLLGDIFELWVGDDILEHPRPI